ncbi:MAG: hypothetical protein U5K54_04155 [Cytophagales bacterium]|nr:hypothetical protein [Cytophagales bacterium]
MKNLFVFLIIVIFASCSGNQNKSNRSLEAGDSRSRACLDSLSQVAGIQQAFVTFAAKDVTVLRNNNLIHGQSAFLKNYFISNTKEETLLTWKPDFVDVSASGDFRSMESMFTQQQQVR